MTDTLAALSQETRLEAFRVLLRYLPYGLSAGDIARLLAVPHNTLSTHLANLQSAGLVQSRRQGRSIIFVAVPTPFYEAVGHFSTPTAGEKTKRAGAAAYNLYSLPVKRPVNANDRNAHNVLFLCTGNSARSIFAEAILNREGNSRFRAFSAGSKPKRKPHPMALKILSDLAYETSALKSKSWSNFALVDAPKMDIVVTVCDQASGESCPQWAGHPLVAHWGIADPVPRTGTTEQKRAAFTAVYRQLVDRITCLINLPMESLNIRELKSELARIGRLEGATQKTLLGTAA